MPDLPRDAGEDSFSMLTALLELPSRRPKRNTLVSDSFSGLFSIRRGTWKLIVGPGGGGAGESTITPESSPPLQLYDLSSDLAEKQNLADEHPAKVAELVALLEQIRRTGRSF